MIAAVTGDSHALDPGTPLGTIPVRIPARQARAGDSAEGRRDTWASAGLLYDELSVGDLAVSRLTGAPCPR